MAACKHGCTGCMLAAFMKRREAEMPWAAFTMNLEWMRHWKDSNRDGTGVHTGADRSRHQLEVMITLEPQKDMFRHFPSFCAMLVPGADRYRPDSAMYFIARPCQSLAACARVRFIAKRRELPELAWRYLINRNLVFNVNTNTS